MLHIVEKTLEISGLKEPKDLFHLTDLHLTYIDDREDEYSHELQIERSHMFPNADKCFKVLREYVKEAKPDVVVSSGDMIDFPSHINLEAIDEFFNKDCKEYLYVLGNHDWNYPRTYNSLYNWRWQVPKFNSILKDNNPFVQVLDLGDVLIVGVDNASDQIFPETVEQFKKVVAIGKPMIIVLHVPLYSKNMIEIIMGEDRQHRPIVVGMPEEYYDKVGNCTSLIPYESTKEFMKIITDPKVPVVAALTGHVHFEFKDDDYVAVDEFAPGKVQFATRLAAPQLRNEPVGMLLHLVPKK